MISLVRVLLFRSRLTPVSRLLRGHLYVASWQGVGSCRKRCEGCSGRHGDFAHVDRACPLATALCLTNERIRVVRPAPPRLACRRRHGSDDLTEGRRLNLVMW
eukprot:6207688-Pleurochrysis_carterae.AAC.5